MAQKNKYPSIKEISRSISKATGEDKEICRIIIQKFVSKIRNYVLDGKSIRLKEFGSFSLTNWKTKAVYNINTGQKNETSIRTIKFSASEKLKEKVRN